MSFSRPTPQDILNRVQADIDVNLPGSDARLRQSAENVLARMTSMASHELFGYLSWIAAQILPDTADADILDRHASIWGLTRKDPAPASGAVQFTGTVSSVIPAGSVVKRADNVEFTADADIYFTSRTNSCLQSQTFDNAAWLKTRSSITANAATAPDGTVTADKIVEDTTATNSHLLTQTAINLSPLQENCFSIYVKADGRTKIELRMAENTNSANRVRADFDLSTQTVSALVNDGTASAAAASMEDAALTWPGAPAGWYRLELSGIASAAGTQTRVLVLLEDISTSYSGDGVSGADVWGAQVESGDHATAYIPTTTAAVTASATDGVGVGTITAVVAGSAGNAVIGTAVTLESPVAGVVSQGAVIDDGSGQGLTDGTDLELDADLRARILERIQNPPQGGAAADYETWGLEVAGVTRVWVYPQQLGLGTVEVLFVMDNKVGTILPSDDEVAAVQAHIDGVRPVTADVTVAAPTQVAVNFDISISPNSTAVQNAIKASLADFLTREGDPGATLYLSRINEAISAAAGEFDHILNAPAANVDLSFGQMPVPGTWTWSGT